MTVADRRSKKICVVVSALGRGGAERSSSLLTKILSQLGHDVHVVTMQDIVEYTFEGKLFNLGAQKRDRDTHFGRVQRMFVLRSYVKKQKFDMVIDNRARNLFYRDFLMNHFVYKGVNKVFVVRNCNLSTYFPKNRFLAKLLYKSAAAVVTVSKEIEETVKDSYDLSNVTQIYNPVAIEESAFVEIAIEETFIMAYGRLDEKAKNFSLLLDAYHKSKLPSKQIKLLLLGSGKDKTLIVDKIKALNIEEFVILKEFDSNPHKYVKKALFTVLSSRYEGFPRVVIESLDCGTPVVSVDCKSGPKEVIENGENGLLVPNFDKMALASAMNTMIEDRVLYQKCKQQAKSSVAHLSLENIAVHWQKLIDEIC